MSDSRPVTFCFLCSTVDNVAKSKKIIRTFPDFIKVFDTVNSRILVEKLYRHEILELLKNYLSNRKHKVIIKVNTVMQFY